MLYCGAGHPLFSEPDAALTAAALAAYPFAGRSYMNEASICGISFRWSAVTSHMEGTALLIASGAYIGFLPRHFAEQWVSRGRMRALLPDRLRFDDTFQVAHLQKDPNPAVELLAAALGKARAPAARSDTSPTLDASIET